ncbi:hypothetical protein EJ06DRAFT_585009 [Trichodelitschia bisporula]|uniref:Uncharacterized protein n=1 Tax=Trichodelitschia bisporula TaxID=703511 RepID=A0A6G1HKE2_9PEZI|nr:hypothetical protein EJ06DRAFT_585009 [Trichodelitschia bisporula]
MSYNYDPQLFQDLDFPVPVYSIFRRAPSVVWRVIVVLRPPLLMAVFSAFLITLSLRIPMLVFLKLMGPRQQYLDYRKRFTWSFSLDDVVMQDVKSESISAAVLWMIVYGTSSNMAYFHLYYTSAWFQHLRFGVPEDRHRSLMIFRNSIEATEVPCSAEMDDMVLLRQICLFHYLRKVERGLLECIRMKSLAYIEVAELTHGAALGEHDYILPLGRYRTHSRSIYLLHNPSKLEGSFEIVERLRLAGVLTRPGMQTKALNFVEQWDTRLLTVAVAIPVIVSLLAAIAWPWMSVRRYGGDVQASVQTGFTIAGFILTAGALLIALVAFMDSNSNAGGLVSQRQRSTVPLRGPERRQSVAFASTLAATRGAGEAGSIALEPIPEGRQPSEQPPHNHQQPDPAGSAGQRSSTQQHQSQRENGHILDLAQAP